MRANAIGSAVSLAVHACIVPVLVAATLLVKPPVRTVSVDFALMKDQTRVTPVPETRKEESKPKIRMLPERTAKKIIETQDALRANTEAMPRKEEQPLSAPTTVTASDAQGETVVHGTSATYADSLGTATSLHLHDGVRESGAQGSASGTGHGAKGGTGEGVKECIAEGSRGYTYIRDAILKNVRYPEEAARSGIEGKVVLSFIVMENGATGRITVATGSGHRLLDESAREAVAATRITRKVPYRVVVRLPIVYRLQADRR
jgi:TonB family protein